MKGFRTLECVGLGPYGFLPFQVYTRFRLSRSYCNSGHLSRARSERVPALNSTAGCLGPMGAHAGEKSFSQGFTHPNPQPCTLPHWPCAPGSWHREKVPRLKVSRFSRHFRVQRLGLRSND